MQSKSGLPDFGEAALHFPSATPLRTRNKRDKEKAKGKLGRARSTADSELSRWCFTLHASYCSPGFVNPQVKMPARHERGARARPQEFDNVLNG